MKQSKTINGGLKREYKKTTNRTTRHKQKQPGPEVIKLFFILNWAEYEICPANKSQITNNCKLCLAKHSWAWKFLC